jgi:F-type H+-transporting ATPase subunit a
MERLLVRILPDLFVSLLDNSFVAMPQLDLNFIVADAFVFFIVLVGIMLLVNLVFYAHAFDISKFLMLSLRFSFANWLKLKIMFGILYTSPMEQFDIISVYGCLGVFTTSIVILFFIIFLIMILVASLGNLIDFVHTTVSREATTVASFIKWVDLIITRDHLSRLVEKIHLRWFTFFFVQILLANLIGLGPLAETVTATLVLPILLSVSFYVATHVFTFGWLGVLSFSGFFMPTGVPSMLRPFIIVIELLSHILKCFSLAIRLFANMFSGHVLMHILFSSAAAVIVGNLLLSFLLTFLTTYVITSFIFIMENFISILQAFVFVTLSAIYGGDFLQSH